MGLTVSVRDPHKSQQRAAVTVEQESKTPKAYQMACQSIDKKE
jgi:hypothetical protein